MKEAGWEIASHGLNGSTTRTSRRDEERAHLREAVRIHTEVTGEPPARLVPRAAPPTTRSRLVMEEGGFLYTADSYADELPYWVAGRTGRSSSCPIRWTPTTCGSRPRKGSTPATSSSAYLKDSFDVLYAEGETAPKMMSVGLHCRLVGRPGRAAALARFLDYVASHERVWVGAADRHRTPLDGASPARSGHGFRRSTVREVA